MPNIAVVLKEEIQRLARKELKANTGSLKKAVAHYRSEIAALKRRIDQLERQARKTAKASPTRPLEDAESDTAHRWRAAGFAQHRKRLGLSAADCGKLHRARRKRWFDGCDPVVFCAFDLLAQDGRSLIGVPLEQRKAQLQRLFDRKPASCLYVSHFDAKQGATLYSQAVALKLEGLVAKRMGSKYVPGERSTDWIKCKVPGAVPPERFKRD